MVPLIMLLTSCDSDASANGIILPENVISAYFDCLDLKNAMVPLTELLSLHDASAIANGIT